MFKNQYRSAFTGILILFLFGYGCTKIDTTNLGQGLIPAVDNIHTFDTTYNIIATNYDNTTVCDTVYRADLHALGIISNDPLFGRTSANIYLELKPDVYPFTFPASDAGSLMIDSAVLVLSYSHSYGDTNLIQKAQVYPLTDSFRLDSNYTTCNVFGYDNSTLLGEQFYTAANFKDSLLDNKVNVANELRIPINSSLIQTFINDSATIFKSDSSFKASFKGFAIVPDQTTGGQGLNYFSLSSSDTRLAIYVRSSVGTTKDTSVINFPLTAYSGAANYIVHNRGTSEITKHLSKPVNGDSLLYIQTSPGSYVQIVIPGLNGLSNRIINRAELIIQQVYSPSTFDDILTPPVNLYLDTKDTSTNGTYIPVPCDFSSTDLSTNFSNLGGSAKSIIDGQGNTLTQYVFNISRYVQSIITKGKNNDILRLSAPYYIRNQTAYVDRCGQSIGLFNVQRNNLAAGRVKLNGTNNTATRIRLHIVYSLL